MIIHLQVIYKTETANPHKRLVCVALCIETNSTVLNNSLNFVSVGPCKTWNVILESGNWNLETRYINY